jgi:hypothetical protein
MSIYKEEYKNVITVTNRKLSSRPFMEQMERVVKLHPKAVILREKDLSEEEYAELAAQILTLCKQYQVPCMLHTYLETARKLQHPYIHLSLFLLKENSEKLSDFLAVGCSIHSVEEAKEAQKLGATYLTAGHIYTTDCKKGLPPRGLDFLREVCNAVTIPVYAIGGIHAGTGQIREVMECGASGACIMSEMMKI